MMELVCDTINDESQCGEAGCYWVDGLYCSADPPAAACTADNSCPGGMFCNFDGGESGSCEMCTDCGGSTDNWAGCTTCGLPEAGAADCTASCQAGGGR